MAHLQMKAVADRLFGDLIEAVTRWELPTLSQAHLADLSFTEAMSAFVGAQAPAIPAVVDFIQVRRALKQRHAMAYLVGLAENTGHGE